VSAVLPDRTTFTPLLCLDARTAVGTAPSPDGVWLRLVERRPDGSSRQLQQVPSARYPTFHNVTADGQVLAWVEDTDNGAHLSLWTADLDDRRPPRHLTDVTGDSVFDGDSPDDLTLHAGRLYWLAPDPGRPEATDVHSILTTGGPVDSRSLPGRWRLSTWPWVANGATDSVGTTLLADLTTGRQVQVARTAGGQTRCSPRWCTVVSLPDHGSTDVELMHPDGGGRERIFRGTAVPAVPDVATLDRFELLWQTDANLDLTHNGQLLVYDLTNRRTVRLSPDAATVTCRRGVVWWTNGDATQAVITWHTLDLRTV
jgi:hypothetical protein